MSNKENAVLDPEKVNNKLMEMGYSQEQLEGLGEGQKRELVEMFKDEMQETSEGVNLKPVRVKINKDSAKFFDPFDNVLSELEGPIVYKHKARAYWGPGSGKVPDCSSMDGITGVETESQEKKKCASCPYNQWGSATDKEGNPTKGKACKEMRRVYIEIDDYKYPVMVTLPPTSITAFDNYISVRVAKGIPDIFQETIISLRKENNDFGNYAVAEFEIGDKVPPQRVLELKEKRKFIKEAALEEDITKDDYIDADYEESSGSSGNEPDLDDIA